MGKVITVAAIKGGTGKTTTAAVLAQAAAKEGKKVLAVDLDAQANLSLILDADFTRGNSYDVLTGAIEPGKAIQATPSGIDVICGHANLSALNTSPGSARRLEAALKNVRRKYDLVVIDTAPTMGEGQNNALFASNGLLIPLCADIVSLLGLKQLLDLAEQVRSLKPSLQIIGIVVTQFNPRTNFDRFMVKTIKERSEAEGIPYLMEIRKSIAVAEAQGTRKSLFDHAPKSKPAEDYMSLYKMVMGV